MKTINVLIVDDNPITTNCIQKRLDKANEYHAKGAIVSIKSFHCPFSISNIHTAGQILEEFMIRNSINFLLLDRDFMDITDPLDVPGENLNPDYLYTAVGVGQKIVKIVEILENVSFDRINKFKGIIVYAFDEPDNSEWYVEPAQIKRQVVDSLRKKVDAENIEILLTNTEIYSLAGINIYEHAGKAFNEKYVYLGKKADFSLYGLFVGELLYHRMLIILERGKRKFISNKRSHLFRKVFMLFLVFSGLSIGGNAAYSLLIKQINNNYYLLNLSLIFSIFLPILVLFLKPEWLISIEDE